jgi:hypothetical protein
MKRILERRDLHSERAIKRAIVEITQLAVSTPPCPNFSLLFLATMDKLDLEDLVKVCEAIGKNKRFSTLAQLGIRVSLEFFDLWKGVCKFLFEQLLWKKVFQYQCSRSMFTALVPFTQEKRKR